MNHELYRRYLLDYIKEARDNSDGTNAGIASCLWEKTIGKFLVTNRDEKQRALSDARKALDDHRHWPQNIILSHLGVEPSELEI